MTDSLLEKIEEDARCEISLIRQHEEDMSKNPPKLNTSQESVKSVGVSAQQEAQKPDANDALTSVIGAKTFTRSSFADYKAGFLDGYEAAMGASSRLATTEHQLENDAVGGVCENKPNIARGETPYD